MAVFAERSGLHLAAEVVNDEVQSVADAEDGDVELEEVWIGSGRVGVVDGGRAAGEDYAEGIMGLDVAERNRAGQHDREDVELSDAPGDELGVLRSEVEDYYCLGVHPLVWQGERRDVNSNCGGGLQRR